jgi:peptidoglycan hydrolase CwlO-like protein
MDSTIIVAAVAGVPSIVAAAFAYQSSKRANEATVEANKIAANKVDGEAYERSRLFYESLLAEAEKHAERLQRQIERLNEQVDRLSSQLAGEQDISNTLRNQIRALQGQIGAMESTLGELRAQVMERAGRPAAQAITARQSSSAPRD